MHPTIVRSVRPLAVALVLGGSMQLLSTLAVANAFRFTSLHPAGAVASEAFAVSAGEQVGVAFVEGEQKGGADVGRVRLGLPRIEAASRAALWRGSASSFTLLEAVLPSVAHTVVQGVQGGARADYASLWMGSAEHSQFLPSNDDEGYSGAHVRGISNGWQVGESGYVTPGTQNDGSARAVMWHAASTPRDFPTILHFGGETDLSLVWAIDGATATSPGQQAGAAGSNRDDLHAILWNGSATDYVDLHPEGAMSSEAYAMSGNRQVGYITTPEGILNAVMWQGTATSMVNLHPAGMEDSVAFGIYDHWVVGDMYPDSDVNSRRAVLWDLNNIQAPVDLSAFLPSGYRYGRAHGIDGDAKGNLWIVGTAWNSELARAEAVMWQYDPIAAQTCSDGVVPPGSYPALTITGNCMINSAVTILGSLMVASGANLDAARQGTRLTVKGNILVATGGILALGCSSGRADCAPTSSWLGAIKVDGNVVALNAKVLAINYVTVGGNVGLYGSTAPVSLPVQDSVISGNLVVDGWSGTVLSVLRNKVGGSVTVSNNVGTNPSSTDVAGNTVGGNLVCSGNTPAAHIGTGGSANNVSGLKSGQCAGL